MLQRRLEEVKDHFQILLSALHMVVDSSQKFLIEEHGKQNIWIPLLFLATDQETSVNGGVAYIYICICRVYVRICNLMYLYPHTHLWCTDSCRLSVLGRTANQKSTIIEESIWMLGGLRK